ncbi:MAG: AP2 domain-containing protein [Ignavibacteriales bacterium]|nr:AP2 domain-containing protein [Ignavibacteriales bacterium]
MRIFLIIFVLTILADRASYPTSKNNSVLLPLITYTESNERNIIMSRHNLSNFINKKFGKLTVLSDAGSNKFGKTLVNVRCNCGNSKVCILSAMINGNTRSCGCSAIETNTKHGLWKSPLYKVWTDMKARCYNINHRNYSSYGGRGIIISDSWLTFKNFYDDMHLTYREGLSIDRTDNNKGYSLANCRWAGKYTQANNTRSVEKAKGYYKYGEKYCAFIIIRNKQKYLGAYNTPEEARDIYLQARQEKLAQIKETQ